jgi:integrase
VVPRGTAAPTTPFVIARVRSIRSQSTPNATRTSQSHCGCSARGRPSWRDVDLAGNRITIGKSKTDAGRRQIDLLPALRDELTAYKAQAPDTGPNAFVFPSATGTERLGENIRPNVLGKAVETANEKLIETGHVPLPEGLTPHKLRHTYASILVALGVDPGSVMDQLGHVDAGFTLKVYRHGMRRDKVAKERLRALVGGAQWEATTASDVATPLLALAA